METSPASPLNDEHSSPLYQSSTEATEPQHFLSPPRQSKPDEKTTTGKHSLTRMNKFKSIHRKIRDRLKRAFDCFWLQPATRINLWFELERGQSSKKFKVHSINQVGELVTRKRVKFSTVFENQSAAFIDLLGDIVAIDVWVVRGCDISQIFSTVETGSQMIGQASYTRMDIACVSTSPIQSNRIQHFRNPSPQPTNLNWVFKHLPHQDWRITLPWWVVRYKHRRIFDN